MWEVLPQVRKQVRQSDVDRPGKLRRNKEVFQANANRLLSDSPYFHSEQVRMCLGEGELYRRETGVGARTRTPPNGKTEMTGNITFQQLPWRAVKIQLFSDNHFIISLQERTSTDAKNRNTIAICRQ